MHHGNFMGCIWVMLNHENHVGFMVNLCEKIIYPTEKTVKNHPCSWWNSSDLVLVFNNIEAESGWAADPWDPWDPWPKSWVYGCTWWGFSHHGRMSFPWPKTWRSSGDHLVGWWCPLYVGIWLGFFKNPIKQPWLIWLGVIIYIFFISSRIGWFSQ